MAEANKELNPLEAYNLLMVFASQRGEHTLRLALHAAIPQVLRPDLLHLLRLNFVPESLDDPAAEADVLFAPFCAEHGNGYYRFDRNVRLHLLTQLDPAYPADAVLRSRQVAGFMLAYCERQGGALAAGDDLIYTAFLDVERWVALAFFDPDAAALQLAAAVKQASESLAMAARIRIGGLASALATPLAQYGKLLAFTAGLEAYGQGNVGKAKDLWEPLGDQEIQIGEINLPSPQSLLKTRLEAPTNEGETETPVPRPKVEPAKPVRDLIFISYSHADKKWADRLVSYLKPIEKTEDIQLWHDARELVAEDAWKAKIENAIARARIAIVLVSAQYLGSKVLMDWDLPMLTKAAEDKSVQLTWICVSPCLWRDTPFAKRPAAHDPNNPLTSLRTGKQTEVLTQIADGIAKRLHFPYSTNKGQNPTIVPPSKEEPLPNVGIRRREGQIFISYAFADNQPLAPETRGWVTDFVDKLQKAIGMKSGGSQVHCWMDHRLERQRSVDETLRQRIRDSKCILVFMSPRYLESEWCKKEMATFVELVGGGKANDRVFLVELQPTDRGNWHQGIHSIMAIKFWDDDIDQPEPMTLGWPVPNPKADRAYWRELNNLAIILARQMQGLPPIPSSSPAMAAPIEPVPGKSKIIWIADPTDDVLDYWESLANILLNWGYSVLPKAAGQYNLREEILFRQALNGDLAQADLLVQLLGTLPGRKPAWADVRFVQLQAEAAKAEADRRKLSFFCWHKPDINLDRITDTSFRALLAAATPLGFEDFCQQIIERLSTPPTPTSPLPSSGPLTVLILADKLDRDLGKQAQDILGELEVDAILVAEPLPTQLPAQYRLDLEAQLGYSQGVLIVYGVAPPSWVQAQHALAHKVLALRRRGIWGALLEGPPEDKPDLGLSNRGLMLLDCRRGLSTEHIEHFVKTLRQEWADHV